MYIKGFEFLTKYKCIFLISSKLRKYCFSSGLFLDVPVYTPDAYNININTCFDFKYL